LKRKKPQKERSNPSTARVDQLQHTMKHVMLTTAVHP